MAADEGAAAMIAPAAEALKPAAAEAADRRSAAGLEAGRRRAAKAMKAGAVLSAVKSRPAAPVQSGVRGKAGVQTGARRSAALVQTRVCRAFKPGRGGAPPLKRWLVEVPPLGKPVAAEAPLARRARLGAPGCQTPTPRGQCRRME